MKTVLATLRTPTDDAERGDVPGWVLVTIVTGSEGLRR